MGGRQADRVKRARARGTRMRRLVAPLVAAGLLLTGGGTKLAAEPGTRYLHQDGQTYAETTSVERVPETTVRTVQKERTIYRPRYVTEFQEKPRVAWVPVSEFRCEPRWHGLLNPFQQAYLTYHMVPHTRWEPRTETVRTPVTYRELVPETEIVEVPTRKLRFVEREVVRRVAVTPTVEPLRPVAGRRTLTARQPAATGRSRVGIARLDGDPPRQGTTPSSLGPIPATVLR